MPAPGKAPRPHPALPLELQRYAALLGFPGSAEMLGILGLLFADDDERRLAAALPGTVTEIARRTALDAARVRSVADRLGRRGAVAFTLTRPRVYRLPGALITLRDRTVVDPDAPRELFQRWERLLDREYPAMVSEMKRRRVPAHIKVLPAEAAVDGAHGDPLATSAAHLLRQARLIVALPCACRTQARRNGRGEDCPAPDVALCIQTDYHARLTLARGLGERIDLAEALERLALTERAGLVHTAAYNPRRGLCLCNCCPCCCEATRLVMKLDFPQSLIPSGFLARVDAGDCTACGSCLDRCPFSAIILDRVAEVDATRCQGCGLCVLDCPEQALTLWPPSAPWQRGGRR
jgi:ferredoxin